MSATPTPSGPFDPAPKPGNKLAGTFAAGRSGGLLSGSMILLISTTVVNLGNYLYNLLMGRWLGPAAFADVSLLVTLFLVVTGSSVTATLQTVAAARYSAIYQAGGHTAALGGLRTWGTCWAWRIGLGCATLMAGGARPSGSSSFTRNRPGRL